MRLVDLDVFAGGLFVMGHKGRVVVLVELARHVVRAVEQGLGRSQGAGGQGDGSKRELEFGSHTVSRGAEGKEE